MSDPKPSLEQLEMHEDFVRRHIGPDEQSLQQMLAALNLSSLDDLVNKTVPASIRSPRPSPRQPPDIIPQCLELLVGRPPTNFFVSQ